MVCNKNLIATMDIFKLNLILFHVFLEGRTFGRIKKLQFALLPVMYKLGVLSTVIMGILFLSAKSVFIGTILLIMNVAFFAIKIASLKQFHGGNSGWNGNSGGWNGNSGGWNINSAPPVHVHIHNPEQSIPIQHYEPYGFQPPSSPSNYVKYPYR